MKNRITSLLFFILGAAVTSVVFTYCCRDEDNNSCEYVAPQDVLMSSLYATEGGNGELIFDYNELVQQSLLQQLNFAGNQNLSYFETSLNDQINTLYNDLGKFTTAFKGIGPRPGGPAPPPPPPSPCNSGICIFLELNKMNEVILDKMPTGFEGRALLLSPDGQVMNEGSVDGGILYFGDMSSNFGSYTGNAHLVIMTFQEGANDFAASQATTLATYIY